MSTAQSNQPAPHHHHKTKWYIWSVLAAGQVFTLSALLAILWNMPEPAPKPKPLPKPYEVILIELQERVNPVLQEIKALDLLIQADVAAVHKIADAIKEDTGKIKIDVETLKKQGFRPAGAAQ